MSLVNAREPRRRSSTYSVVNERARCLAAGAVTILAASADDHLTAAGRKAGKMADVDFRMLKS